MKNLWLNSIFFVFAVFLCTCSPKAPKIQSNEIVNKSFKGPYFVGGDSLYMFKADVKTYGKEVGGLLLLKSTHKDTLKATFLSQVGLKFFDLEIYKDTFKVKEVIPQLNIKAVLKTLQDDIRQLTCWDFQRFENIKNVLVKDSVSILRYDYAQDFLYIYLDKENRLLKSQKTLGHRRKLKNSIIYHYSSNGRVESIDLKHYNFKLEIKLNTLQQ